MTRPGRLAPPSFVLFTSLLFNSGRSSSCDHYRGLARRFRRLSIDRNARQSLSPTRMQRRAWTVNRPPQKLLRTQATTQSSDCCRDFFRRRVSPAAVHPDRSVHLNTTSTRSSVCWIHPGSSLVELKWAKSPSIDENRCYVYL